MDNKSQLVQQFAKKVVGLILPKYRGLFAELTVKETLAMLLAERPNQLFVLFRLALDSKNLKAMVAAMQYLQKAVGLSIFKMNQVDLSRGYILGQTIRLGNAEGACLLIQSLVREAGHLVHHQKDQLNPLVANLIGTLLLGDRPIPGGLIPEGLYALFAISQHTNRQPLKDTIKSIAFQLLHRVVRELQDTACFSKQRKARFLLAYRQTAKEQPCIAKMQNQLGLQRVVAKVLQQVVAAVAHEQTAESDPGMGELECEIGRKLQLHQARKGDFAGLLTLMVQSLRDCYQDKQRKKGIVFILECLSFLFELIGPVVLTEPSFCLLLSKGLLEVLVPSIRQVESSSEKQYSLALRLCSEIFIRFVGEGLPHLEEVVQIVLRRVNDRKTTAARVIEGICFVSQIFKERRTVSQLYGAFDCRVGCSNLVHGLFGMLVAAAQGKFSRKDEYKFSLQDKAEIRQKALEALEQVVGLQQVVGQEQVIGQEQGFRLACSEQVKALREAKTGKTKLQQVVAKFNTKAQLGVKEMYSKGIVRLQENAKDIATTLLEGFGFDPRELGRFLTEPREYNQSILAQLVGRVTVGCCLSEAFQRLARRICLPADDFKRRAALFVQKVVHSPAIREYIPHSEALCSVLTAKEEQAKSLAASLPLSQGKIEDVLEAYSLVRRLNEESKPIASVPRLARIGGEGLVLWLEQEWPALLITASSVLEEDEASEIEQRRAIGLLVKTLVLAGWTGLEQSFDSILKQGLKQTHLRLIQDMRLQPRSLQLLRALLEACQKHCTLFRDWWEQVLEHVHICFCFLGGEYDSAKELEYNNSLLLKRCVGEKFVANFVESVLQALQGHQSEPRFHVALLTVALVQSRKGIFLLIPKLLHCLALSLARRPWPSQSWLACAHLLADNCSLNVSIATQTLDILKGLTVSVLGKSLPAEKHLLQFLGGLMGRETTASEVCSHGIQMLRGVLDSGRVTAWPQFLGALNVPSRNVPSKQGVLNMLEALDPEVKKGCRQLVLAVLLRQVNDLDINHSEQALASFRQLYTQTLPEDPVPLLQLLTSKFDLKSYTLRVGAIQLFYEVALYTAKNQPATLGSVVALLQRAFRAQISDRAEDSKQVGEILTARFVDLVLACAPSLDLSCYLDSLLELVASQEESLMQISFGELGRLIRQKQLTPQQWQLLVAFSNSVVETAPLNNFGKSVLVNKPFTFGGKEILSQRINFNRLRAQIKNKSFFNRSLIHLQLAEVLSVAIERGLPAVLAPNVAECSAKQAQWAAKFNSQPIARLALWRHQSFSNFGEAPCLLKLEQLSLWNCFRTGLIEDVGSDFFAEQTSAVLLLVVSHNEEFDDLVEQTGSFSPVEVKYESESQYYAHLEQEVKQLLAMHGFERLAVHRQLLDSVLDQLKDREMPKSIQRLLLSSLKGSIYRLGDERIQRQGNQLFDKAKACIRVM